MGIATRVINIVLGVWLFISAFVWPHNLAQQTDTWIVGALITAASIAALFWERIRVANTVLAIWLFLFTLIAPHANVGTVWNNVIIAIVVFLVSLAPSQPEARMRRPLEQTR